ncbi:MAG: hypothetical protein ACP5MG_05140 [Verrucomicrobiia bacterium]|jgi:hypothetical protein
MANKSEIGWKRTTPEGEELQVFARHTGGRWLFFFRYKRYEKWQKLEKPTLEDWLLLLDAVKRRIPRRLFDPQEEVRIKRAILQNYPDAELK